MFGLLGTLLYGLVYGHAWSKADEVEQKSRTQSMQSGYKYYTDKKGRMRNTITGKKCTSEEVYKHMFPVSIKEKERQYDKISYNLFKKQFYCVPDSPNFHFFLSYEEANEFVKSLKEKHSRYKYLEVNKTLYSKIDLENYKINKMGVFHFDYDEYVGKDVANKPWKRK